MADLSHSPGGALHEALLAVPVVEIRSNASASGSLLNVGLEGEVADHDGGLAPTASLSQASDEDTPRADVLQEKHRKVAARKHSRKHSHKLSVLPPDVLLEKLYKNAEKLEAAKEADGAIADTIRCTALARIVYGDGHWKLAEAHSLLATRYFQLKGYLPQAQQHAEHARDVMLGAVQMASSRQDKDSIFAILFDVYCTLGAALGGQGRHEEAERSLQKADRILAEQKRRHNADKSGSSSNVHNAAERQVMEARLRTLQGKLAASLGKTAPAVAYVEKAISVTEDLHGRDAAELIPLYQLLGKVEQSAGASANHEKAINAYLQAHSIATANHGEGSEETAKTAQALAAAYACMGTEGETSSESYLMQSLSKYQVLYGPSDERVIGCQDDLARLMIRTSRSDEAVQLLSSTLAARREAFGEYSDNLVATHRLIGSVHMSEGRPELAVQAFKKCLDIETAVYGANHRKPKETKKTVDMLMANPAVAAKLQKSKMEAGRPRFNAISVPSTAPGGCKPIL